MSLNMQPPRGQEGALLASPSKRLQELLAARRRLQLEERHLLQVQRELNDADPLAAARQADIEAALEEIPHKGSMLDAEIKRLIGNGSRP
jgi:hypothetical protein